MGVGELAVDPRYAVVLLASAGGGSLASACCTVIDFYARPDHAQRMLSAPGMTGAVLTISIPTEIGSDHDR